MIIALASRLSSLAKLVACLFLNQKVMGSIPGLGNFSSATLAPEMVEWWNLMPMPGIWCRCRDRDLAWIGMIPVPLGIGIIPEPSAEGVVQCSETNTNLEGENVVGCSVRGLGDYCSCQHA